MGNASQEQNFCQEKKISIDSPRSPPGKATVPQSGKSFLTMLHQPLLQGHPWPPPTRGKPPEHPSHPSLKGSSLPQKPRFYHSQISFLCGPHFHQSLTSNRHCTISIANEVYYADTQTTVLRKQSPFERLCTQRHSSPGHCWGMEEGGYLGSPAEHHLERTARWAMQGGQERDMG